MDPLYNINILYIKIVLIDIDGHWSLAGQLTNFLLHILCARYQLRNLQDKKEEQLGHDGKTDI